jgi:hypothetical protein
MPTTSSKTTSDSDYLRELAERLRRIPVMYGTDDGDIDRLCEIAKQLERKERQRMKISPTQLQMLKDCDDGGPTDYADFALRSGVPAFGWANRERVIAALIRKGLLDNDLKVTEAGRAVTRGANIVQD